MVALPTPARDATSSMDMPATPRSASSSSAAVMIARSACSLRGRPRCGAPPAPAAPPVPWPRRRSLAAPPVPARRPAARLPGPARPGLGSPEQPEYPRAPGCSAHWTSETNRSVFDCLKDIMPPSRMPERPSRSPSPRSAPPRASSARTRTVPSSRQAPAWRRGTLHRIRGTGLFPERTAGRAARDTGPFPAVHADRIPAPAFPRTTLRPLPHHPGTPGPALAPAAARARTAAPAPLSPAPPRPLTSPAPSDAAPAPPGRATRPRATAASRPPTLRAGRPCGSASSWWRRS